MPANSLSFPIFLRCLDCNDKIMRILILGGTGFIGSNLCAKLVYAGYDVVVISNGEPVEPVDSIEYFTKGMEQPGLLDQLLPSCSHVIHLASATTPGTSHLAPGRELGGNIVPLAHLLECLQRAANTHLIFVSSGGAIYGDQPVDAANEDTPISPVSYYGAGKAAVEVFLRAYQAQTGHGVTVLRPSNLYGPGQGLRIGFGIVPTLFNCVRSQRPFEIWGDGETVRDYLYVSDFVGLCLCSIPWSVDRTEFSIFNVGSDTGYSINELLDEIGMINGNPIEVIRHPPRGVDVKRIVLDSSAARQLLGWKSRTTLRKGLELTWDWINSQSVF